MKNQEFPILYFMIGLPASGKSTFAESLGVNVHSVDNMRESLIGTRASMKNNAVAIELVLRKVLLNLRKGKSCVYDATNTTAPNRIKILQNLKRVAKFQAIACFMNTPFEVCLSRNAAREQPVPESMIMHMAERFQIPIIQEGWDKVDVIEFDNEHYMQRN